MATSTVSESTTQSVLEEVSATKQSRPVVKSSTARLVSLDVFRGATIAGMILVNNPGSWSYIYPQLRHAEWSGWTFTDLIFPFFLFIVGVAMTLSFARRVERGDDTNKIMLHVVQRAVIIFACGLFLAGFPFGLILNHSFSFSTIRIPGVLQRIAVCYLVASFVVLKTGIKGQIGVTLGLLTIYWLLMTLVPVPGVGTGSFAKEGNFAQYIDSMLLDGHMWKVSKTWDPEGIISTLPAIATTLAGVLTGHWLRSSKTQAEKTVGFFFAGNLCLLAGVIMDIWVPINKNLWTSSYTVFMAGMALNCFAVFYWFIDVKGYKRWAKPFAIYGMNAIAVFVLSGIMARLLGLIKVGQADGTEISLSAYIYQNFFASWAGPFNGSLFFAITYVLFWLGLMAILYRYKIFIKI
jgi:predicted acyltransferase